MNLSELNPDEDALLLGWMRVIIQADGEYSGEEREEVRALREVLGDERFDAAVATAKTRFPTTAALKSASKDRMRESAQRAIYSYLSELADVDDAVDAEERPLKWLASWWELKART